MTDERDITALERRQAVLAARALQEVRMHTVMVIGGGLVVLAIFLLLGRSFGGGSAAAAARAALWFIPAWLVAAAVNLYVGTTHGYTVVEELPIGLVVFGVPAAVAALFWRRFSHRG